MLLRKVTKLIYIIAQPIDDSADLSDIVKFSYRCGYKILSDDLMQGLRSRRTAKSNINAA